MADKKEGVTVRHTKTSAPSVDDDKQLEADKERVRAIQDETTDFQKKSHKQNNK